ncbi:hypothetical protein [Bradyrhizobium iriomotense]|uniref:hypothetical protein n=1 Tax=Bradyrhizobium iriomotense TaxID=441950 RepID=UPI001B89E4EB|nr:hypothetical protein [Bradyrhizobium iriomotense]MBR0784825.1 hypothetical protein [Bradyrhizobium iriomotense]
MSRRAASPQARIGGLVLGLTCAVIVASPSARADHEVSYFPSFYPHEIRIEPLDPEEAAREFVNKTDPLHVYLGTAPHFASNIPGHLKSVDSLKSLITISVNPQSSQLQGREARCHAIEQAAAALAARPDVVMHPYPITPYHADYLCHADRVSPGKATREPTDAAAPTFRAGADMSLFSPRARVQETDWDVVLDETSVNALLIDAGVGSNEWPAPPWTKEGWFQAYRLLRPALSQASDREQVDELYERLTHSEFIDRTEQLNLERELVTGLIGSCERAVVGYRLRREFYSDDFSDGIENAAVDSQSGLNSAVFLRTVKLKDFLWNGSLRIGIDPHPTAAWNPVAGFTDSAGRLVWSTVGDNAFLPIPFNSRWVQNRAEVRTVDEPSIKQSVRIPNDALMPQAITGSLEPVGPRHGAMAKALYRLSASNFSDGSVMEPADLLYPYALAFRWGTGGHDAATHDPDIAAATRLMRERLRGVKLVRVEETSRSIADQTFTYRSPIIEVYLDNLTFDEQENALIAPPWSSVPWHVLALMDAAVERGIAAFSRGEAERRHLPWLDLVRDPAQLKTLRALIREFAQTGYRPAALESLVGPETAKGRWALLDKFVEANGHLLVTNGPYRLKAWSPGAFVFEVVREFTYPVGLGTFNGFAYPARALINRMERAGDLVLVSADAEFAVKQQRDHRLVRAPLQPDTMRGTLLPIRPESHYVVIGQDGRVAHAGNLVRQPDNRFAVSLPTTLQSGVYTLFAAIFLDRNTINPAIGRIELRNSGTIGKAGQAGDARDEERKP